MNNNDREILRSNMTYLMRELVVDEQFISQLQERKILSNNNAEDILAKPTRNGRAHEFLMLLPRKGPHAFATFIEILQKSDDQQHIAGQLMRGKENIGSGDSGNNHVSIPAGESISFYVSELDNTKPFLDVNVKPVDTNSSYFKQQFQDPNNYRFERLPRGRAIIISIQNFFSKDILGRNLSEREGAEFDVYNLNRLFEGLSFTTKVFTNLSGKDIKTELLKESKHADHNKADAFILCILSHGAQGTIFGRDGDSVDIDQDICAPFDGINCPALIGKPKIFIIQACQGEKVTTGYKTPQSDCIADQAEAKVSEEEVEEITGNMKKLEMGDDDFTAPKIHEKADMLLAYSTVPGYRSWRRPDLGSWYVRALVQIFADRANCEHIIDLFTKVRAAVLEMQTHYNTGNLYRQVTRTDSTLSKNYYFFPGVTAAPAK